MANVKISQLTANAAKIASTDRIAIAKDTGGGTFASRYVTGAEVNEVKLDTTPQLGGNLDVNGYQITSDNDQDVVINPNGVGIVKIESNLHLRDTAGGTAKQINLYEGFSNGSNYIGIKAPNSLSTDTTYTLPTADGTSGQVLSTNGTGTLSWATAGGGITVGTTAVTSGTDGRVFFQAGGVVQQDANFTFDNTLKRLTLRAVNTAATDIPLVVRNSTNTQNFLVVNGAGDVYNNGAGGVTSNTFYGENVGRSASGSSNTAYGIESARDLTTGTQNTFIGAAAGRINNTGGSNTFVGRSAGYLNTSGSSNTFIGLSAGSSNTAGIDNTFVGVNSGISNAANSNTYIGVNSLSNNTTGTNNSALGVNAGRLIADGVTAATIVSNSVIIGVNTRVNGNNQTNQIVIGHQAIGLGSNTTVVGNSSTTLFRPYGNVAIGADTAGARLDVRAQGALSTDIAFRVRNSVDTVTLTEIQGTGNLITRHNSSGSSLGLFHRTDTTGFSLTTGTSGYGTGNGIEIVTHTWILSSGARQFAFTTNGGTDGDLWTFQNNGTGAGKRMSLSKSGNETFCWSGENFSIGGNIWGNPPTETNSFGIKNGTAPSTNATDAFKLYSADITAGNAAPHFRTENGAIVKVYQETTAVGASTLVSNAGTNITDTDTFDGYTLKQIVKALRNQGLLA